MRLIHAVVLCSIMLIPGLALAKGMDYLAVVKSARHAACMAGKAQFKQSQQNTMPAYRFARPSYRTRLMQISQPAGKPASAQVYTEVWANSRDSRGRIRIAGAVLDVTVTAKGKTTTRPGWLPTGFLGTAPR